MFRALHALGNAFRQRAQAAGLNRTRGMVLWYVHTHPEGTTATTLRRVLGVTAASISNTLGDMEREGLISRIPNPHDARSTLIQLTDRGRDLMEVFPRIVAEVEAQAFAGFTQEERDQLRALLERISANLSEDDNVNEQTVVGTVHGQE